MMCERKTPSMDAKINYNPNEKNAIAVRFSYQRPSLPARTAFMAARPMAGLPAAARKMSSVPPSITRGRSVPA